jgi:hypothetical protein
MKAEDIRELNLRLQEQAQRTGNIAMHNGAFMSAALSLFAEGVAQMAEMNEHLKKIANPLFTVNAEAPWVSFTGIEGDPIAIDRGTVSAVRSFVYDDNRVQTVIWSQGSGCFFNVREPMEEVCAKLGIPLREDGIHGDDASNEQADR